MDRKKTLREDQMNDVAEAQGIARWLLQREWRGPGDMDNAMRRIETRYGVPYSLLWSLRYRPPKDILMQPYRRLRAAYEAEKERQMRQLKHELEITKAKAGADHPAVRAVEALVREAEG